MKNKMQKEVRIDTVGGSRFVVPIRHIFSHIQADYRYTYLVVSDLFHERYGFPVILLGLAAEPGNKVGAYRNPRDNGPDVIDQVKVGLP